jgi:hypothetical protein
MMANHVIGNIPHRSQILIVIAVVAVENFVMRGGVIICRQIDGNRPRIVHDLAGDGKSLQSSM